jgi:hypothetical protein
VTDREELQRTLTLAKSALRAPPAVRARVRQRLVTGAPVPAGVARVAPAPSRVLVRRSLWVSLGVCAGYWLGYHRVGASLGESANEGDVPGASTRAPIQASIQAPIQAGAGDEDAARSAARLDATLPDRGLTKVDAPRLRSAPPPARHRAERAAQPDLGAEVALLERAERAIRAGEGALALSFVDELDHKFPSSPLREERAAARILAQCVNARSSATPARDAARAAAERFLARSSSVYADRVRRLCVSDRDNAISNREERSEPGH